MSSVAAVAVDDESGSTAFATAMLEGLTKSPRPPSPMNGSGGSGGGIRTNIDVAAAEPIVISLSIVLRPTVVDGGITSFFSSWMSLLLSLLGSLSINVVVVSVVFVDVIKGFRCC